MQLFYILTPILAILLGYLFGSIPTGVLLGKTQGIDVMKYGSKNSGGTNVGRLLGKKFGILCMVLDILKCYLPLLITLIVMTNIQIAFSLTPFNQFKELVISAVAIAVCLGHTFPIFNNFNGGKCVATFAGYILFISPLLFLFGITLFLILLKVSKKVSICSIVTVPSVFVVSLIPFILDLTVLKDPTSFNGGIYLGPTYFVHMTYISSIAIFLLAFLVVFRHKANIERLKQGKEPETHFVKHTKEELENNK